MKVAVRMKDTSPALRAGLPAVLLAACGGLIQGFDTGGISNASPAIIAQFHLPLAAQGLVTGLVLVGAMIGAIVGGMLADRLGRRGGLLVCGIVFSAGVLFEVLAPSLAVLLCARVVAGLAIGASSIVSTLYIAEVSPPEKRGGYLSFFQLAVVFGIVCGVLVSMAAGSHAWRIIMGAGIVPGLVLFFGMLAMPESPAWIAHRTSPPAAEKPKAGFSTPAVQLALVVGVVVYLTQHGPDQRQVLPQQCFIATGMPLQVGPQIGGGGHRLGKDGRPKILSHHGRDQTLFGVKMPEERHFVHPGDPGNFPRG